MLLFLVEVSRASDWDNIVACHRGLAQVTTWNYQRGTMGKFRLCHPRFEEKAYQSATAQASFPVIFYHCVYDLLRIRYKVISKIISLFCVLQCVDISSCGNFCVIGYSSGHVDKYNLQSGIHRGSLGDPCKSTCSVMTMTLNLSFLQMEHVFKQYLAM